MKASIISHWSKFALTVVMAASLTSVGVADDKLDAPKKQEIKQESDSDKDSKREELVKKRRLSTISKTQIAVEGFEPIEMFSAMSSGDVDVIIKTKSEADANMVVTNNTDRPLAIEMPAAFAAVPVLRQGFGGGGGGLGGGGQGGGGQGGGQGGGNQGVGGGAGGGQGGGGFGGGGGGQGGGGGGGVFNIPPGRSGRLQLKTVCLEEGKPNPKSRMNYVVQPLETLNSDPKIYEMLRMLANDEISQPVAQAAAWSVTDGLTWNQMLVKNRIERMDGSYVRFFHPNHLRFAQQVVVAAGERAELRAKALRELEKSTGGSEAAYNATNNQ